MTHGVRVRAAAPADALAIARVQTRGWQHGYRGLLPAAFLDALSLSASEQRWTSRLDHTERLSTVLVAEDDTTEPPRVIGVALVGPAADPGTGDDRPVVGQLYALYVDSEFWSAGVGHALHEAAIAKLVHQGYAEAALWVLDGNERAIRFYRRHGWTDTGLTTVDHQPGADLVEHCMRRALP